MSDPSLLFYQALERFKRISIYGNAIHDLSVPYVSSCIELYDPFVGYDDVTYDSIEL